MPWAGFLLRLAGMQSFKSFVALLCAPVLLTATVTAAEKVKDAPAVSKKPSLTYYYFDG